MAGYMYLGSQRVCPVVLMGGSSELASYSVTDGVATKLTCELTGHEFDNITSISDYAFYNSFYARPDMTGPLVFDSVTSISTYGLDYAFYGCTGLTSVSFKSLNSIDSNGLYGAFNGCNNIETADFSSVKTLNANAFYNTFANCSKLSFIDFSSLETIDGGFYSTFSWCAALKRIDFPSLNRIKSQSFYWAFQNCYNIENIYFNSLNTNSFEDNYALTRMFSGTTATTSGTCTVHFPSNLQTVVSGLTGYPTFGGNASRIVLSFDLPATE